MTDESREDGEFADGGPVRVTDKRKVGKTAPEPTPEERLAQEEADSAERVRLTQWLDQHGALDELHPEMSLQGLREEVLRVQSVEDEGRGIGRNRPEDEDEPASNALSVVTAFIVYINHDGTARGVSDMTTALSIEREASLNDIWVGAAQVQRDIDRTVISQATVGLMQQVSSAAVQHAQMQARLGGGHQPGAIHRPGG